ncbi:hypothetical protein [Streptomyces sp. H27-H1]|uniref:hypothetical protein n=1 Tax=Streptomyces sp. H27-H1 TaxID=2996461 RepID=UPI00226ED3B5|nr:hypothetical protein [Streptomyces sp. H27-H1]
MNERSGRRTDPGPRAGSATVAGGPKRVGTKIRPDSSGQAGAEEPDGGSEGAT